MKNNKEEIRQTAVAGQFYTSNPEALSKEIKQFLDNVDVNRKDKNIIGIIAPHAGYIYSGQVAVFGYKQVQGKPITTAMVIAPSHRAAFVGASIFSGRAFRTPIGDLPINRKIVDKLIEYPDFGYVASADKYEHSLEVQVPFLQCVLDNFTLVPVLIGDQREKNCDYVSDILKEVLQKEKDILFVASSDLYHGYSYNECVNKDRKFLEAVKSYDASAMMDGIRRDTYMACGAGPIYILMKVTKALGAKTVEVLKYTNSNDITGIKGDYVVGYSSVIFY